MAKKQTRRSISVSRMTYERLKAFCETNHISMSQLVETRVNDFLGEGAAAPTAGATPTAVRPGTASTGPTIGHAIGQANRPAPSAPAPFRPLPGSPAPKPTSEAAPVRPSAPAPMTSAAARFAVDPPPPIIKPKQETAAPKPAEKTANQIFTF